MTSFLFEFCITSCQNFIIVCCGRPFMQIVNYMWYLRMICGHSQWGQSPACWWSDQLLPILFTLYSTTLYSTLTTARPNRCYFELTDIKTCHCYYLLFTDWELWMNNCSNNNRETLSAVVDYCVLRSFFRLDAFLTRK